MIILNGTQYDTIEDLNLYLDTLTISEYAKSCIRNDFNGVPNAPVIPLLPVTSQQLRSALVLLSIQQNNPSLHPESIKAFIQTLPEPNRSLAYQQWEYSNEMLRDNPLVASMAPALGLTPADLDAIWIYARTL